MLFLVSISKPSIRFLLNGWSPVEKSWTAKSKANKLNTQKVLPHVTLNLQLCLAKYINTNVRTWTHNCVQCQKSKVQHHTVTPLSTFVVPDNQFDHVHIDPLPLLSEGLCLLTCIDRYTCWVEVIPISSITSKTIAQAFISSWFFCFGVPSTITQFPWSYQDPYYLLPSYGKWHCRTFP